MEEVEAEDGCQYVAEVDPRTTYTIAATHPELGGREDPFGESNPSCSAPTAANTARTHASPTASHSTK